VLIPFGGGGLYPSSRSVVPKLGVAASTFAANFDNWFAVNKRVTSNTNG
jgi:hypothetical protein